MQLNTNYSVCCAKSPTNILADLALPILDNEARHAAKFRGVVSHDHSPKPQGLGSQHEVVGTNRQRVGLGAGKMRANRSVIGGICVVSEADPKPFKGVRKEKWKKGRPGWNQYLRINRLPIAPPIAIISTCPLRPLYFAGLKLGKSVPNTACVALSPPMSSVAFAVTRTPLFVSGNKTAQASQLPSEPP